MSCRYRCLSHDRVKMFENFLNVSFFTKGVFLTIISGFFLIVAVNFEFLIGWISSIDGETTISINLHTAAITGLSAWVGGIQLHLLRKNVEKKARINV